MLEYSKFALKRQFVDTEYSFPLHWPHENKNMPPHNPGTSNAVLTTNRQNSAWPGLPECCDHPLRRKNKETTRKERTTAPLHSCGDQEDGFAQPDKAGWNSKSKAAMKSLGMSKLARALTSACGSSHAAPLPRESPFPFQVTASTCGHLWDILWPHIQNKCHPVPHRNWVSHWVPLFLLPSDGSVRVCGAE